MNARASHFENFLEVRFTQSALDNKDTLLAPKTEVYTSYGKDFWCHEENFEQLPFDSRPQFLAHYKITEQEFYQTASLEEVCNNDNSSANSTAKVSASAKTSKSKK